MDAEPTKKQRIAGWVLSALPSLLLIFSGVMKLTKSPEVVEGFTKFGFAETVIQPLGVVELLSTVLFLVPKTSFIGAILLTGYLGGAICTHMRVGEPFFMQFAFGVIVWVGFGLRRPRAIRAGF